MLPDLSALSGSQVGLMVALPVAAYYAIKYLMSKDVNKEERRRGAAKMAATLQAHGLRYVPEFLIDYSVGDYSGMGQKMATLGKLFISGEEHVVAELDKVFERILDKRLASAEGVAYLQKRLSDHIHVADVAKGGPVDPLAKVAPVVPAAPVQ